MDISQEQLLHAVAQKIYDKKGFNILALDIRAISSLYEFLLIAEGNVERHVQSLGRDVVDLLEASGSTVFHVDGAQHGDWIVVDAGAIVVHLFVSDLREKYALETLLKKAEIVALKIDWKKEKQDE